MNIADHDIIVAMREDSNQGFRLLMVRYKETLYWHIRRLVVSHADAQDAVQETFVRVFRNFSQCNEVNSFKAWLYRIATNEALRVLERRQRDNAIPLEQVFDAQADSYINYKDLEAVRLQKAILALPPKQQLTFNLRYYDEMDYDEIASVANSTVSSAKMNYHLAKERIIKYT